MKSEEIDMGSEAITKSIDLANQLAQAFFEASEEERRLSESALDRANKLQQAEIELKRLRGDITEEESINQKRQLAQEQIIEKANLQIQAEQQRAQEAAKALQLAKEELDSRGRILVQSEQDLENETKLLQATIERKKQLQEIAKQTMMVGGGSALGVPPKVTPTGAAVAAKEELAGRPFDAEIKALNEKIDELAKATTGELYKNLVKSAEALVTAQIDVDKISKSVALQAENITTQAQTDILLENQKAITENAAMSAKAIEEGVTRIQAVGEANEQAKSYILQAVSDQEITAEEQVKISQNLSILMSGIKDGNADQIKILQNLVNINNTFRTQLDDVIKQVDQINQKRKSPTGIQ